jgi:hypothetical protein
MSKLKYTFEEFTNIIIQYQKKQVLPPEFENYKPQMDKLPDKPEYPKPNECCGSGCIPCVYDIYEDYNDKFIEKTRLLYEEVVKGDPNVQ